MVYVFFTVVFLAFLASGIYLTVLQELHKKSRGIPVECDSMQEIEEILKEKLNCPFLNDIRINEKEDIEFKCKYDTHIGTLKDGSLYVDKSTRKFSSHRDVEETWYLQRYIENIFYPKDGEENLEQKFLLYIKLFNISRIIKYLLILCVAIWIFGQLGGMDSIKSKGVSQMYFTDYSEEITIGQALHATCPKGKWSSNKIGESLYHVTFSGYASNGNLLTILFQTNGSECSIKSLILGEEDVTWMQGLVLEAIYENATTESNGEKGSEFPIVSSEDTKAAIPISDEVKVVESAVEPEYENMPTYDDENILDEDMITEDWYDDGEMYADDENQGNLNDLLDEVMESRASYGKSFHWEQGENEDSCGADVTILIEEDMGVIMLTGDCWHGADEDEYLGLAVNEYDDSIEFENENGEQLLVHMLEDGGMYIEDYRAHSGATFTGTYY